MSELGSGIVVAGLRPESRATVMPSVAECRQPAHIQTSRERPVSETIPLSNTIAAAIPFAALMADTAATDLAPHLIPPAEALGHLRCLPLTDDGCNRVRHGMAPVAGEWLPAEGAAAGEQLLLLCHDRLVAVAETAGCDSSTQAPTLRLLRVFSQECPLHAGR